MLRTPRLALTVLASLFGVALVVEALVALEWIRPVGNAPGEGGSWVIGVAVWAGELALLLAVILCARAALSRRAAPWWVALLPLAGLALVVVHGLGFDSYDAPGRIRFMDNTFPNWRWIAFVGPASAVASFLAWRFRRPGSALAALVVLLLFGSYTITGVGH